MRRFIFDIDPDLSWIPDFWSWFIEFLEWCTSLIGHIKFDGEVTCDGAQAPIYLGANLLLIGIVVWLFDSNVYVFMKVN